MDESFAKIYIQEAGQYVLVNQELASKLPMIIKTFMTLDHKLLSDMTQGEVVEFFRRSSGKTLRVLASDLGVDHKHLDKIEKNQIKKVNDNLMRKLSEIFGSKFETAMVEIGVKISR